MDKLHCKYVKIVATGGDLDAASQIKVTEDVVGIEAAPELIEHITSQNPNPEDRVELGTKFKVRGVFANADYDTLVYLLGGTHTSSVYTKTQGLRTLPNYDIRIAAYRKSDGLEILHDITHVNFTAMVPINLEPGKQYYLPFEADSTSDSELTIDNSAT